MAQELTIENVTVLDCTGREPLRGCRVALSEGCIASVGAPQVPSRSAGEVLDGEGLTLMPGLTDAHVHLGLTGAGGTHGSSPWVEYVLNVVRLIETTLLEGFTTVRDAGGLEPAYARAVESGRIVGPRILPSGSILSQTGGHGDLRQSHEGVIEGATIPGLVARHEIVDGADAVRRATREQLRRGATQIKVFASGGVLSPTDPFDRPQFTIAELSAAVVVARSWGTYVLAHCHTSLSVRNALRAGVRSVEHASLVDEEAATAIATRGAFAVPTLLIFDELANAPSTGPVTALQRAKAADLVTKLPESIRLLREVRARIASGSDIVGPDQARRGREIALKAEVIGNETAILSATRVNAELFGLSDRIGTVEVGKDADLILVDGEPLDDIDILADPRRIRVVIKGGQIVKDIDGRCGGLSGIRG